MHITTSTILTLLPALTLSHPLTTRQYPTDGDANYRGFTMFAARSASPIHFAPVVATQTGLFLGTNTSSYCPSPPVPDCSGFSNTTQIGCAASDGSATACSMTVSVPGGQRLYVNAQTGSVNYTTAHSSYVPDGAFQSGFEFTQGVNGQPGTLSFTGGGATGFVACPVEGESGVWSVRVPFEGVNDGSCLGFRILTTGTNATAWQYT